jgi:hypothetical protein
MKNTADLIALANSNIPDNTTGLVSPSDVRECLTQGADSGLNKLDTSSQSVAGPVAFGSTVTKGGKGVLIAARERDILRGFSTAATQQPTTLGTAIQVEFGAANAASELSLAANGTLTCNVSGTYAIRFKLQFGRSGASGVSYLMTRILKNGVQFGVTQSTRLSSSDSIIPTDSRVVMELLAGDTVKMELIRDSLGVNSGGLYQQISSHGWIAAPSALLVSSVIEGVA